MKNSLKTDKNNIRMTSKAYRDSKMMEYSLKTDKDMKRMKYINSLIKQFIKATGVKYIDINSKQFIQDFYEWILSRKSIGENYTSVLDYMGVHPAYDDKIAEVGKGEYDSIFLDDKTTIITPYTEELTNLTEGLVIASDFRVYGDTPIFISDKAENKKSDSLDCKKIRRFITQNPYKSECIKNWEELHNSGKSNITVGIYGNTYDNDINYKIKRLEKFKDKLENDSYKIEHIINGDEYFYAIASDRKTKIKVKSLIR